MIKHYYAGFEPSKAAFWDEFSFDLNYKEK